MTLPISKDLLNVLELTETDLTIYSILASKPVRTEDEITVISSLPRENVVTSLEKLSAKGYIRKIEGKIKQYFAVAPPITILSEAEAKLQKNLTKQCHCISKQSLPPIYSLTYSLIFPF